MVKGDYPIYISNHQKNKGRTYNLDVITSKLKRNVTTILDEEHKVGNLNLKNDSQSQKILIYRDWMINLNFKNIVDLLYYSDADFNSDENIINVGKIKCKMDLDSGIKIFQKECGECCFNIYLYNKLNLFNE